MHSWNEGYHTDTNYSAGYFPQINPLYVKHLFTFKHQAFPTIDENFTGCELGFGQGVSVVMHAAASPGKWYGTDFNPNQVNFAQKLAKYGSVAVHLSDDAFGDYANREDVPMLDYICVHGIWSWISHPNQQSIVDFAKKKLKVGGVLYLSYNVGPGFTFFEPIRQVMYDYMKTCGVPAKTQESQVPGIIDLVDKLVSFKKGYGDSALVKDRIDRILHNNGLTHNYLCHEYLNDDWDISSHSIVAERLDQAKLSFVCQHPFYSNIENFVLKEEETKILDRFSGTEVYNGLKDYITGEQFRADYFVRGSRRLNEKQYREELDKLCFILVADHDVDEITLDTRNGRAVLNPQNFQPVIEVMKDHRVYSFKELGDNIVNNKYRKFKNAEGNDYSQQDLINTVIFLLCTNHIAPAVKENTISKDIIKRCKNINRAVINTEAGAEVTYVVSPVTMCAFRIDDITRMVLALIMVRPDVNEQEVYQAFKPMIAEHDLKLFDKERKPITDPDEIDKTFKKNIHNIFTKTIPTYKKLFVI